jgi:hypothetical protein
MVRLRVGSALGDGDGSGVRLRIGVRDGSGDKEGRGEGANVEFEHAQRGVSGHDGRHCDQVSDIVKHLSSGSQHIVGPV